MVDFHHWRYFFRTALSVYLKKLLICILLKSVGSCESSWLSVGNKVRCHFFSEQSLRWRSCWAGEDFSGWIIIQGQVTPILLSFHRIQICCLSMPVASLLPFIFRGRVGLLTIVLMGYSWLWDQWSCLALLRGPYVTLDIKTVSTPWKANNFSPSHSLYLL